MSCSHLVLEMTAPRLLLKIMPISRYIVVNAASAVESNKRNLRKDNFIDPAKMGANILIRGIKHNMATALNILCFNLSL